MTEPFTILNVMGPFREPQEAAFSYDYSVQRSTWATPQGIRVKVGIAEELEGLKSKFSDLSGTPGQQMRINQLLMRAIADQKVHLANEEGMFSERRDVMIDPFTGPLVHLYSVLAVWMEAEKNNLRQQIQEQIGV